MKTKTILLTLTLLASLARADIIGNVYATDFSGHDVLVSSNGETIYSGYIQTNMTSDPVFSTYSASMTLTVSISEDCTNQIICGTNSYHVVKGEIVKDVK